MLWPTVTLVSWVAMAGLVVALGRGSTSRYECEQNRVKQVAVATAEHPAGSRLPDVPAGWWLVDDGADGTWHGRAVVGPFADRWDAELAALADGDAASTRLVVHGTQRSAGAVLVRQAPDERAWFAELSGHLEGLPEDWDAVITEADALATLVVEIGAALVEAGMPLHDGSVSGTGGVCLTPDPGSLGVLVAWRQHERMDRLHVRGTAAADAVRRTMNGAVADVLTHLGLSVEPIGPEGCFRVRSDAPD